MAPPFDDPAAPRPRPTPRWANIGCDEASPFWRCDGGTGSGRPAIRLAAAGDDGDEVSGDEGRCGGSAAGTASPANEADEDSFPRAAERIGGDGAVPKVGVGSGALVPAFPDALSNSAISSRRACMSVGLCLVVVQGDRERERPRERVRCLRSSAEARSSVRCHSRVSGDVGETGDVGDMGDVGDANCMSPSSEPSLLSGLLVVVVAGSP